jgi:hypothetical protein
VVASDDRSREKNDFEEEGPDASQEVCCYGVGVGVGDVMEWIESQKRALDIGVTGRGGCWG